MRAHGGWDVVKDKTRRQIKIVGGFTCQAKECGFYVPGSRKPQKVLQADSHVQPVFQKADSGGSVDNAWER